MHVSAQFVLDMGLGTPAWRSMPDPGPPLLGRLWKQTTYRSGGGTLGWSPVSSSEAGRARF